MSMQALVNAYQTAYQKCNGMRPRLSATKQNKLLSLNETLKKYQIDPEHYIKISYKLWSEWCDERSMPPVPINVLCSKAAVDRFRTLDPIPEHVVVREKVVNVIIAMATHGVREMLKGRTHKDVQAEIDGEMRQYFPKWWYKMRDDNTPLYQDAHAIAMEYIAWFYGVEHEGGDTYPIIADRAAKKWKNYV